MTLLRYLLSAYFAALAVLSALSGLEGDPGLAASYAIAAGYLSWRLGSPE